MAYRRKRKSRGTWLPVIGSDRENDEDVVYKISPRRQVVTADWRGNVVTEVIDLTYDVPVGEDGDITTHTMADVVGSEYFLKRIVGKVFVDIERDADNQLVRQVLVGCGFFVARAASDGNGPIDFETGSEQERFNNYSPLAASTMREPWIWRRTWMLQDVGAPALGVPRVYPQSNTYYGSVLDGPHIDAKTKRRIGNDDRLYFITSVTQWPNVVPDDGPYADYTVEVLLDYRLFGSLRKAKTRGAF